VWRPPFINDVNSDGRPVVGLAVPDVSEVVHRGPSLASSGLTAGLTLAAIVYRSHGAQNSDVLSQQGTRRPTMSVLLLGLVLFVQSAGSATDMSFFVGEWRTSGTTGPRSFKVEQRGADPIVTIDGQREPLVGTLYVAAQPRPQRPEAIVVASGSRIFVLRRDSDAVIVDMFSKFDDRPSFYWTDRFTRSQSSSSPR
jgi:hypothetical protein